MDMEFVMGTESRKTIAIIEDDEHIGNILARCLEDEGYRTCRAYSGTEARYLLAEQKPDLILLDLMLPGLSGEALLSEICDTPVIIVSAKAGVDNKVDTLLGGAVDYLTKPFEMKELLARIAVQLRKKAHSAVDGMSDESGRRTLAVGNLQLDIALREVTAGGVSVKLTRTEYAILKMLMLNQGQVIPKSVMLDDISRDTPDCTDGSLKQHVSNLRKKLRAAGGKDYIESVWGIGFKLSTE